MTRQRHADTNFRPLLAQVDRALRQLVTAVLAVPGLGRVQCSAGYAGGRGQQCPTFYAMLGASDEDRKSTRLNSSHVRISYAVFCLKKKKEVNTSVRYPRHPALHSAYHD